VSWVSGLGVKPYTNEIIWGWIGTHADYDKLIKRS
jgi:hypothetical protein